MGFSIRVMPGVRFRVSSRGVSASLGPRIARVSVGTRGVGVSTGMGPVSVGAGLSYGAALGLAGMPHRRARSSGPSASSIAAEERAARQAAVRDKRAAEVAAAAEAMRHIARLQEQEFEPITKPPFTRLSPDEIARVETWWEELQAGVPGTVLETVNHALADNERQSAAVSLEGAEISVVILAPTLEEMPERTIVVSPAGTPTTKAMTKTERNGWHTAAVVGHTAATLKETFAVAPTVQSVRAVAVSRQGDEGFRVLLFGVFGRDQVSRINWSGVEGLETLGRLSQLNHVGKTRELRPLDLAAEPELEALLGTLQQSVLEDT